MQSSHSAMLHPSAGHVQPSRSGHSQSPTPGTLHGGVQQQPMQLKQTTATLIDNFTQAPFLASSTTGLPSSKQAHTTKAVTTSSDSKQRNFNAQKLYAGQAGKN